MAVLCDGHSFHFYRFVNKRHAKASPQIFLGVFPDDSKKVDLDSSAEGGLSFESFIRRLRRACDALYYVFLSGYRSGLEAYWKSSVEKAKAQGKARDSTPGWYNAYIFHVHLDRRIDRRPCVLDDTHPPGFRVGEERRRRRKPRYLTTPF